MKRVKSGNYDKDINNYHIGEMIDYINETHKNDTNYYGKLSYYEIQLNEKCYKITIQTLKKYTKYIIEEEK